MVMVFGQAEGQTVRAEPRRRTQVNAVHKPAAGRRQSLFLAWHITLPLASACDLGNLDSIRDTYIDEYTERTSCSP